MAVFPTRGGEDRFSGTGPATIRPNLSNRRACAICGVIFICWCGLRIGQAQAAAPAPPSAPPTTSQSAPPSSASPSNSEEIATREEPTFKVNVRLVLVRVVVRDSQGHAIGNLHKEDFQLFDRGKPQVVTHFSLEQPGLVVASEQKGAEPSGSVEVTGENKVGPAIPERFVAYLFDDVHLKLEDVAVVRIAAEKHLASLKPSDRAAIFSTSGQTVLDSTDDREQLRQALLHLQPRPVASSGVQQCPDISYYMADLIVNRMDAQALGVATQDTLACMFQNNPRFFQEAQEVALNTATAQLSLGDAETRLALSVLRDVVRRMAIFPGKRSIVLVSPGFLTPQLEYDYMETVDRALRSDIVISAIDARGLYTVVPGGDASQQSIGSPATSGFKTQYQVSSAREEAFVLQDLANSTGGIFFQNSNDLVEGFRRVSDTPEYSYTLGFSPQGLKADGSFHVLKVKLTGQDKKLVVDSRRGYYAPKHMADASEEAKREIEEELFSEGEMHDLPVDLHTQFFKPSDTGAKLSVLAHVDVRRLTFQKVGGRNRNDLTIVAGLFDRNGNFITGIEKVLEMRLKDETLEKELKAGVTVKSSFDVKPGSYMVRLVVRDAEKQLMSAESGAVQIP